MAGDIEKAKREMRWAKSSADDRRWDQLEPKIQAIEEALKGVPDADAAPVLAELKPLKEKLAAGVREEKAGRIEREIRRNLSAAADDLNRGYKESPQLPKTIARLDSAEAREVLSPQTLAALRAEIAVLQSKSGGAPPPPPPPPKPAAADSSQARAIEDDVARNLRMAAEEISRFPERAEPNLARAVAKLDSPEAKQHLSPEAMQRLRAQTAEFQAKLEGARRAEKAVALEREIKRSLAAAADELDRGYAESPQLLKAMTRLNSEEAREVLPPETVAKLQAEIAPLQAKSTVKPPPPPPPKPAATPPAAAAAPAAATPAPAAVDEQARLIESDIARTMRFALDELGRSPLQCDHYVAKLTTRLDSDDAKRHLPPETLQRLRAQTDDFQAKVEAAKREDRARTLEDFIGRFIRNAESDLSYNRRQAEGHLERASERIEKDDVKQLLSAETVAKFRSEIRRVEGLVAAAAKKDGLDRAQPILQELEQRIARPIFDDPQPAWRTLGDLDSLKSRIRGALSEVPKDDADVKAIEARITKVDGIIAGQTAKLGRDQAHARIAQLWEIEQKAVAGWEEESAGDGKSYEMSKTALAVRRLTWFQNDTDVRTIGAEYKSDKEIQALIEQAGKARESALAKLQAAFTAYVAHLEKQSRPSNRIDLEEPARLSGRAGGDFEGTPHKDADVARAKALYDRWQAEIEADRKARQAKYDELSVAAAKAWPTILSTIKAEDGFDPQDSGAKGRTVLIQELRNRIGWDFSGRYDFAIWVNETPVVGNYDKTVGAAVNEACEKAGLPLDDHTDWDAVIVVGGPGKIKQRFNVVVRDRNNLEIGRIEEWRPVDCVMCTVIALRAGPAAVGPKA